MENYFLDLLGEFGLQDSVTIAYLKSRNIYSSIDLWQNQHKAYFHKHRERFEHVLLRIARDMEGEYIEDMFDEELDMSTVASEIEMCEPKKVAGKRKRRKRTISFHFI